MTDEKKIISEKSMPDEQVRELLSKYDKESAYRDLKGKMGWFVALLAVAFSIYQLYASILPPPPAQIHRTIHLAFALGLIYLLYPATGRGHRSKIAWYDGLLALIAVSSSLYWVFNFDQLITRTGNYNQTDIFFGGLVIVLVLEATRRVVGVPIVIIATLFMLYALYGNHMPGFLHHRGVSLKRLISHMYFSLEGILGTPLSVSATFIFLFLLFGAFLERTGVGAYFNDLALTLAGKRIGGPAKVAVFSSALQGTISGSSVANVVTSGSFTIPMMRRLGYRPEFAGAVEAAASTGGQIMPPIMGAAAFLMAEFTGVPYWEIAKAAAIPAILYFTGIWIMVHFEAKRIGLRGLTEEEMPDRKNVWKHSYLLLPIIAIITFLMLGDSPMRAALKGIVMTIIVSMFRKETRMTLPGVFRALEAGARAALGVAAATATAGMIVGVVTLTGVGLKFANGLIGFAGGVPLLMLFFTMISSILLGMGTPTTANYIITSTIAAPAIIAMGAPVLSAHMFTFYFGIVADITPPVALAAFAASGIAGGAAMKTGVNSTKLAIAAFIIPYIFVLSPQILLIDATFFEASFVILTAIIGMLGISAGLIGYWLAPVYWWERIWAAGAGLLLIIPGWTSDTIGMGSLAIIFVLQVIRARNNNKPLDTPLID
ncbi:C4-dicarboxylate ABC transporter [Ammoniphilus oxalaticus]|uniref:C4-dicarboxylate ABC transporter n=1 Tax=Ammoniphilus oxalaticus TaxID=66863 RepID=A0A419SR30_9BACL|nr:TRAP transporter permease [Ammoniphilus oxalaticus]RKD27006.1 C4-dicarboxylate ABC transporter [Ammoniphilus oxalaticus]